MKNKIIKWLYSYFRPGKRNFVSRFLDKQASMRVMEAMITKTSNFRNTYWLGRPIWQFPLGVWVLQEMISQIQPDLIIETGTFRGGSAFYYASLCDLLKNGKVLSIDIAAKETIPHPRITYWQASSADPEVMIKARDFAGKIQAKKILVILDSDHSKDHVCRELESFAPWLPIDSYIHVQDGNIDEFWQFESGRPGPLVAVKEFLKKHPEFIRDKEVELRYVLTVHPFGWLKKINETQRLS